jgi:hypothetical protein
MDCRADGTRILFDVSKRNPINAKDAEVLAEDAEMFPLRASARTFATFAFKNRRPFGRDLKMLVDAMFIRGWISF